MIGRIICLLSVAVLLSCTGGERETFGEPITIKAATPVIDIMKGSKKYHEKLVKVEGRISSECPTGCWVNLADETGMIFVEMGGAGITIPPRVGHTAVVQGQVWAKRNVPHIRATGIEIR